MTDREAMKLALEALVDFGWHIENCQQFPTWAEPKKHPPCTCGYDTAITALRQALEHVPDTMKMLEPDMGIDRGAWDDVPDATKWVDELRGGDETEEEPFGYFQYDIRLDAWVQSKEHKAGIAFYTAPPKREWVELTFEEADRLASKYSSGFRSDHNDALHLVGEVEALLKEKNHDRG